MPDVSVQNNGNLSSSIDFSKEAYEYDWQIPMTPKVFEALGAQKWCETVCYDHFDDRARIISKPGERIKDQDILRVLEGVLPKTSIEKVKKIENQESIYSFPIQGVKSISEGDHIIRVLKRKKAYIKNLGINFSTSALTMVVNIEKEKLGAFIKMLNLYLERKIRGKSINIIFNEVVVTGEQSTKGKADSFFENALLNVLYAIFLKLISAVIPLPITLGGQFVGLILGGATLGVMWKTGQKFYQEAWEKFKKDRSFNMYTLIAVGTGSAWLYSMSLIFFPALLISTALQYEFISVTMILAIINFGRGTRSRAWERANSMVQSIKEAYANNQPQLVRIAKSQTVDLEAGDSEYEEVSYRSIKEGDVLLVRAAERFPVDGVIISQSETLVEQSAITGEARLVNKQINDIVHSGSYNKKNKVLIRASCDGENGTLSKLIRERDNRRKESFFSPRIDKLANLFVPTIIAIAIVSGLAWFMFGALPLAVQSMMSVLLCACPCAMGLSLIAFSIGEYKALVHEIIIKRGNAIEALAKVDTVVFDKTGTLTTPAIQTVFTQEGKLSKEDILLMAASVEKASVNQEHPIAQSLIRKSYSKAILPCKNVQECESGVVGIAVMNGREYNIVVGDKMLLESKNVTIKPEYGAEEEKILNKKMTSTYIAIDGTCVGVIGLSHTLREGAQEAIQELNKMGIDVYMLTGDKKKPALDVAAQLGIKENRVGHEKKTEDKKNFVKALKDAGRSVAVIGDGFNDTLAFKEADVGIAVGSWTKATSKSDMVLRNLNVATAITIARATMKTIYQNLGWTLFYNIFSLAAAIGLLLNPVIACFSMAFSSSCVIFNSCWLHFQIDYECALRKDPDANTPWYEKIKAHFSLETFIQTVKMFFSMVEKKDQIHSVRPCLEPTVTKETIKRFSSPKEVYVINSDPSPSPVLKPSPSPILVV